MMTTTTNHVMSKKETSTDLYCRGLDLFIESTLKPDVRLRQCARNQGCYDELMQIREDVLEYLKTLRPKV